MPAENIYTKTEQRKEIKMIYTSYYSNRELMFAPAQLRLVGISNSVPKWFAGEVFKELAPSWEMIHMEDKKEYERLYRSQVLAKLYPCEVMRTLDNSILLCWERPGPFCHRHIVAEWLEKATGKPVQEFRSKYSPEQDAQLTFDF